MLAKRKLLSVFSIFLVVVLLALTAYQIFSQAGEGVKVKSSIHRTELEDSLIVKYTVLNKEGRDLNYTFYFYINDELRNNKTFFLPPKEKVIFTANINTTRTPVNKVRFLVYKEGDPEPVSDIVHYVD